MSDGSKIEWLARPGTNPATWNPIKAKSHISGKVGTHCEHASEGCRNCYAEAGYNQRFGTGLSYTRHSRDVTTTYIDENTLTKPLHWRAPRTIFVCSTSDIFGDWVPDDIIDRVFAIAALCPQHTFIFLTKRAQRMSEYLGNNRRSGPSCGMPPIWHIGMTQDDPSWQDTKDWPLPNVWIGVSAENQKVADERIPLLLDTPAVCRFVSCEPMLGVIDLRQWIPRSSLLYMTRCEHCGWAGSSGHCGADIDDDVFCPMPYIDWVICGGESGPNARPVHPDWIFGLRDQCEKATIPFFFKSWGEWECTYDRDFDDPDWRGCDIAQNKTPNGQWLNIEGGTGFHGERVIRVDRVGKAAAGDRIYGVQHHAWPEVK